MRIPIRFGHVIFVFMILMMFMILIMFLPAACDKDDETATAPIQDLTPRLGIGSTWVYNSIYGDEVDVLTATVIGEEAVNGVDCYVVELLYDNPARRSLSIPENLPTSGLGEDFAVYLISGNKYWFDKATWNLKKLEHYFESPKGNKTSSVINYTFFDDDFAASFSLNKSWTYESQQKTRNIEYPVITWEAKVVSVEDVAVPAGTFQCFKIEHTRIKSMGEDLPQVITPKTEWWSTEEPFIGLVKSQLIEPWEYPDIWELVSYSQFIESSG